MDVRLGSLLIFTNRLDLTQVPHCVGQRRFALGWKCNWSLPNLSFKIALVLLGPLYFHINVRMSFFIFTKKAS